MKAIRTAIALALAGVSATAMAEIPEAQVTGGTVAGEVADGLSMFKGIPFAAPPTGDLRWKAPQPVVPWLGTRKTTSFGAGCMQDPGLAKQMGADVPLSEDCLFIDVWTPADTPADGLPVIAWIYGGGYNSGMTSVPLYDGANFARSGVVFVSISYRVGPFGFLATPELSAESGHGSGNYGMLDQIAGLKWVQENIAQFGGDPAKVTIMGHSAGGFAVSELAASPLAKGLFRGVISESGGNFAPPQGTPFAGSNLMTLPLAEANGKKWLAGLGAATLAEARALPAAELEKAQHAEGAPRFWPPMDGYVLPGGALAYGRAGVMYSKFDTQVTTTGNHFEESEFLLGLRVGMGLELPITEDVFARLEYSYTEYEKSSLATSGGPEDFENSEGLFRAAIGWRF